MGDTIGGDCELVESSGGVLEGEVRLKEVSEARSGSMPTEDREGRNCVVVVLVVSFENLFRGWDVGEKGLHRSGFLPCCSGMGDEGRDLR